MCVFLGGGGEAVGLVMYTGHPLLKPSSGNRKSGLSRGVASREWYGRNNNTQFVL